MIIIKGKSASSGVAVAPIAAKPDASDEDRVTLLTSLNPEAELRRFHAAQEKVIAQLGELARKLDRKSVKRKLASLKPIK